MQGDGFLSYFMNQTRMEQVYQVASVHASNTAGGENLMGSTLVNLFETLATWQYFKLKCC